MGLALCRWDGSLVDVNPAYAAILGRTVEETLALTYWDITPKDYAEQEQAQLDSLRRTGRYGPYEKEYLRKDGTRVPVRLSGCLLQHEGETLLWSSAEDISERKRAEGALRESEERLRLFIGHAPVALAMFDRKMRYIAASHRWLTDYGLEGRDVTGRSHYEIFPDIPDRWRAVHRRGMAGEVIQATDDRFERADGSTRWLQWEVRPWHDATGGVGGIVLFTEDITGRKRAETLLNGQKQVLEMTAAGAPLEETLTALVQLIESQSPGMLGSILLLDEDGIHVRHGAAPSLPAEFIAAVDGQPIGPRAGSCGTAAYRKEAVHVEDIATDPLWADYKAAALPHGLRACWSTPIFNAQRQVLGLFAMYYRQPGLPQPEHRQLIDIATNTAAIAINSHRSEKELRESEARTRSVFEQANDGIYIISSENRYLDANARGLELLGYTRDELLRMGVADVLAPGEVARLSTEPPKMMSGTPHLAEWEHVRKDGSIFPGEVSARRLDDHSYLAILRDLTERRRTEEALKTSRRLLAETERMGKVGGWEFDVDTGKQNWTEEVYTIHEVDFTFDPTVEKGVNFYAPESRPIIERAVQRAIEHGEPFDMELEIITGKGNRRSIHTIGKADPGRRRVYGFFQDITERKRVEQSLAQKATQLASLNELGTSLSSTLDLHARAHAALAGILAAASPDLVLLFLREDDGLRLLDAASWAGLGHAETPDHQVGHCLCGLGAKEGRPLYSLDIHTDFRCTWDECKKAGIKSFAVLPLKSNDEVIGVLGLASATERDFQKQSAFLETMAAQVATGIQNALLHQELKAHAADLERRVEERSALLREANEDLALAVEHAQAADRAKSAFLSAMSHELRTPLNSVIGFTGVLLGGLAGAIKPEQREPLTIVQRNGRHLLDLINDVLDLSKIEANEMRLSPGPFDLAQVAREALDSIAPAASAKGLALARDLALEQLAIPGDRRRTAQILLNLLSNAVKFTEAGTVTLSLSAGNGKALIAVRDTGPGIAGGDLPRLFREFEQLDVGLGRRNEGTGLGLALSRRLARLMDGDIVVASRPGQGSTFSLFLPLGVP